MDRPRLYEPENLILNENKIKQFRKLETNSEKRAYFVQDDDAWTKEIMLDFHMMNTLPDTLTNSNENIATLTTIMSDLLLEMINNNITPEAGVKKFFLILQKHSVHRPPFSIEVFTKEEAEKIMQHALDTMFKHYSLYEFAFKPKVEMNFKAQNVVPIVTNLTDLLEMEEVEDAKSVKGLSEYFGLEEEPQEGEGEDEQEQEEQENVQSKILESDPQTVEEAIAREMKRLKAAAKRTMKLKEADLEQILEDVKGGKKK